MITISIIILTMVVTAIMLVRERETLKQEKVPPVPVLVFVLGILIALFQPFVLSRVDAGNAGVIVNLTGSDRGASDVQSARGWVVYNAYTKELYEFPTYQQHIDYKKQTVILKGGFSTTIRPTFNYKLKKSEIPAMFRELRLPLEEIEQGWLKTAIISSVNDVSNKWEVDQIFNDREKFEAEIIAECNSRVGKWFNVSLLRTNIVPPKSIKAAIEAQVKAVKETQAKEQQVLVTEANGKIMVAQAKADSAQAVISANGRAEAALISARAEAEAIKIKQRELTPEYIRFTEVSRWNGQVSQVRAGSGAGLLLDVR